MPECAPTLAEDVAAVSGSGIPEPIHGRLGRAQWRALGHHFGLTQFGVGHETLQPGAQLPVRHRHTVADEFVVIGTRAPGGSVSYPDDEIAPCQTEEGRVVVPRNGTPCE